jgi:predicted patatin/cPLA2 family phospholipase
MCSALEELGLRDAFDAIYGTSAGAFNAAYFMTGQSRFSSSIYHKHVNNRQFIDVKRLLVPGQVVMNLEFLVYEVVASHRPLKWESLVFPDIPTTFLATSALDGKPVRLREFSSKEDVYKALLASARIPVIAGGPVRWRRRLFFDGGIAEPIPFRSAVGDGATHVVVLLTRPNEDAKAVLGPVVRRILKQHLDRYPQILAGMEAGVDEYRDEVRELLTRSGSGSEPPHVLAIKPEGPEVDRLETSRDALLQGLEAGYSAVKKAFEL